MKILVCGDAMIDKYWHGEVTRISPEAPVPVVRITHAEVRGGAAANVAANCKAMGAQVETLYSKSIAQIEKIRLIGRGQHVVRIDFDNPQNPIDESAFYDLLKWAEIVVLIDYGKGAFNEDNLPSLIAACMDRNVPVFIDPKGHDYTKYKGASMVKPNIDEMRELVGGWSTEDELEAKARFLMSRSHLGSILFTRAYQGMTLYQDNKTTHIKALAKHVVDVSGAGETAIAAFAVAFGRGLGMEVSAEYANKAAGIAVERFGTSIATRHEVFGD